MANYNGVSVELSDWEFDKSKSAAINTTRITLRISSHMKGSKGCNFQTSYN